MQDLALTEACVADAALERAPVAQAQRSAPPRADGQGTSRADSGRGRVALIGRQHGAHFNAVLVPTRPPVSPFLAIREASRATGEMRRPNRGEVRDA
ncbi:hypothetical protein [Niveibacterium sp. SC-1]|uniref:hypothetical protein n=1 Tax=Niveibacterium sp. SC-1 TaxID=3135646 RepID=UPI00311F0B06